VTILIEHGDLGNCLPRNLSYAISFPAKLERVLMKFPSRVASLASTLGWFVISTSAIAQPITDPTKPPPTPPASSSDTATPAQANQPNQAQATQAKPGQAPPSPFSFTAAYTADFLSGVSGGAGRGSNYVHLVKVSAAYDGSSVGHEGLTGLVSLVHLSGSDFTARRIGGVQSVSASETDFQALRLYEAWLQQEFLGGQGAVKAGLIDLNSTFDVQETAALFLNASHGIGPDLGDSGLNGPSDYPTPALGVTGVDRPAEGWTAQVGLFDAAAGDPAHRSQVLALKLNGALLIAQVEKRFGEVARIEAGGWTYAGAFPSLDQIAASGAPKKVFGNGGVYVLAEGRLLPKPGDKDGGLNGWVRVGLANGDINLVDRYLGGGLVYTGWFENRPKDEMGIAIARAGLGYGARLTGAQAGHRIGRAETALEVTYRYAYKDWLNIQPDVQYVINPHGDRDIANAVVVGLRLAFTYSK
jgi:porin